MTHAALPSSERLSGSTLRTAQHASTSVCHRLSGWISGCGVTTRRLMSNRLLHLLDQPPRLGEEVLRVEQDDVGGRVGAGGEVHEHGVLEAGCDRHVLHAVGVERPAQHLRRVQLLDVVGGLEQSSPRHPT